MKRILLAGAALGAMTFAAQAADPGGARYNPMSPVPSWQVTGDMSMHFGFGRWGTDTDKSSVIFGGLARANVFITPNVALQFDINGDSNYNGGDDKNDAAFNGAVHLNYRTPGYQIGVMVSHGHMSWWDDRFSTIALEGQTYIGPFQIAGQIGWSGETDGNDRAVYGHATARYFITPNLVASGDIGYATFSDSSQWASAWRWGLTLEGKLNNSPFGAFVRYEGARVEFDGGGEEGNQTFLIGGRLHFGPPSTLQAASQGGANTVDNNPFTGVNRLRFFD